MPSDGVLGFNPRIQLRSWSRRVKCKRIVIQVMDRLEGKKKKRESMAAHTCSVIANLLKTNQIQKALVEAEKLHEDRCLIAAYGQIAHFCELIAENITYLCRQSNFEYLRCEVGEAVSSLVFAAAYCGELLELNRMRNMFEDWFGYGFITDQVELRKGNLVTPKIKQNLQIQKDSDDVKYDLLQQIAKQNRISFKILGSKRKFNQSHEQKSNSKDSSNDKASRANSGQSFKNSSCKSARTDGRPNRPYFIHPNLPEYDDVVSRINDFKAKRAKLFSRL